MSRCVQAVCRNGGADGAQVGGAHVARAAGPVHARRPRHRKAAGASNGCRGSVAIAVAALGTVAALGGATTLVEAQVDQLTRDPSVGEAADRVARQVGGELDK